MAAEKTFLELQQNKMAIAGFWTEEYKNVIIHNTERMYTTEIIKEWQITDIVMNKDKVLIQWCKRFRELTKEELKEKYNR